MKEGSSGDALALADAQAQVMSPDCRQWREVSLACHLDDSNKQLPGLIRKHYCRLLLAYERELTQGALSHTISKKPRAEKESKAKSAQADVAARVSKAAAKRPAPQAQVGQSGTFVHFLLPPWPKDCRGMPVCPCMPL